MKKLIILFTTIILTQVFCVALSQNEKVYNMHTDKAYIIDLDVRPMDMQITNFNVLKVTTVTDIFSNNSQLIIETFEEGISYISYKFKNKSYKVKVLVDNNSKQDENLMELDKIKENNK